MLYRVARAGGRKNVAQRVSVGPKRRKVRQPAIGGRKERTAVARLQQF
jgi:hypothetical protein